RRHSRTRTPPAGRHSRKPHSHPPAGTTERDPPRAAPARRVAAGATRGAYHRVCLISAYRRRMPTPYGSRGGMAFGVEELRVLRRALALALHPTSASAEDVQDCLRLADSLDEA